MNFFNKVKSRIKVRNMIYVIAYFSFACILIISAISDSFSSETQWRIGVRGSQNGIPLPNWLVSCFLLFAGTLLLIGVYPFLSSFIKNTEYKKMIQIVESMGDIDAIGLMLSEIEKSKYAKGDLRFNENILFYMKGTDVTVIPSKIIRDIRVKIDGNNRSGTNYVCIYYGNDVLEIESSKKNILLLLNDMKKTFNFIFTQNP